MKDEEEKRIDKGVDKSHMDCHLGKVKVKGGIQSFKNAKSANVC